MPPWIGSLTCLRSLDCFVIGKRKSCQPGELRNLNLYGAVAITHLERVKNIGCKRSQFICKRESAFFKYELGYRRTT
uniref:Putative ovule protein n=1 Tax=Solanum chacoense TaxID=4108 RepID=A0A0V0GUU1_SOLCH